MQKRIRVIFSIISILFLGAVPICVSAQKPDTLIKKLDSLKTKTADSTSKQLNVVAPVAYEEAKLTPASYFILLGSDLKQAFTKPFHMKKKDWITAGGFIALEVGLSFADKNIQSNALQMRNDSKTLRDVSTYVTRFGGSYEVYTLVFMGGFGALFNKPKMLNTTFLATQAYITGEAVHQVVNLLTGRQRPDYYTSVGSPPSPSFHGPFSSVRDLSGNRIASSFPSGHTTVAFAAATVFAMEYRDKRLIPIIAYTAASLIGISRITENRHWFSDVVAGAVLGYFSGKQVVDNYHRYAKLKAPSIKKNTVAFNLDYRFGTMMPQVIYKFR